MVVNHEQQGISRAFMGNRELTANRFERGIAEKRKASVRNSITFVDPDEEVPTTNTKDPNVEYLVI
jgi:hypothetical protein